MELKSVTPFGDVVVTFFAERETRFNSNNIPFSYKASVTFEEQTVNGIAYQGYLNLRYGPRFVEVNEKLVPIEPKYRYADGFRIIRVGTLFSQPTQNATNKLLRSGEDAANKISDLGLAELQRSNLKELFQREIDRAKQEIFYKETEIEKLKAKISDLSTEIDMIGLYKNAT